ncbi:MAG TPA: SdrD B-like domain-containing protein, partial [Saprospiraceae bacterium]|nr:SdrD B-like domain-containing protein [Saprospiraceae bacterium]
MFKFSTRIIFFVIFFTFLKSYIIGQNCSVNAGIDQTICIGESAFLSVSDGITTLPQGSSYTWSNGEQNYKIVVSPSVTTTYTVTITSGSCSATDQVTVQVSAKPTISLVNLTSANCGTSNGSISVSATGVGSPSYAWSSGQNSSTISGVSAGTYKVTVTDDNGCTNSAIYVVGVNGSSGISGVVYGDFNYNSINDQFFQGYRNVPVKLYGSNAAGNSELVAQTTTNATGSYSFPNVSFANGERYRLEFTPPLNYFVTKEANKDNLQVRYISGPVCNADLAISVPSDYCHTDNPMYTVPQQINGNGLLGGSTAVQTAIWTANYQNKGFPGSADYTPSASAATQSTVGSLYGVGYQRYSKQAFYSAYLKRHTGLGLGGLDAIYKIDFSSGSAGSPNLYLKLSNLGVNVGSIGARDIPANFGEPSYDVEAFGKIGKVGIGDIDVSDDGATLYAVNLFQKTLIGINIGNPVSNNPTLQLNIPIPNPGCGDDWRPFGLKYYGGKLFVSGVCSGESTGGVPTGYVFEYTPNVGFNFNPILTFPIDWTRPTVGCDGAQWGPWDSEYPTNASQPIFSDMEFEVDGSMVIGLRNREGDMYGFQNYEPILGSTNLISRFNPGDILRADPNGDGTFTLENNGVSQGKVGCGSGNGEGPGGGEFFCGDNFLCHNEVATGALGKFTGSGEAISTAIDPFRAWSQGIMRFSVIDGSTLNGYEFIQTDVNNPQGFGKANGLGDIEFFCDPAPLEIGDYLWVDDNKNGIQDPKELPLAGQTIKLFDINGTEKASTTTDVAGYYYFLNVSPSTQYYITVENYNNGLESGGQTYVLTKPNQGADDRIDSDGEVKGFGVPTAILNKPSILLTTGLPGETNHSYDFGFSTCSINVSAGQDVVLCAGTCVTLTTGVSGAFGAVTYSWSTGASTSSVLVCPDQNRTYIVTVTDQLGCKATDNIMISIEQLPISGINGPTNICTNTPANFTAINAGNGATYLWTFDGGSTQDGDFNDISEIVTWTNAQAATNRNITLYVESSNGCFSNYTKQIAIGNSVAASAGNDRSVCGSGGCFEIGGTLSQVAPLGGTVAWSPTTYLSSSVIPNPQVCLPSNVSNITYTVTVTKNGCTATDQVVVTKDNTLNPV